MQQASESQEIQDPATKGLQYRLCCVETSVVFTSVVFTSIVITSVVFTSVVFTSVVLILVLC